MLNISECASISHGEAHAARHSSISTSTEQHTDAFHQQLTSVGNAWVKTFSHASISVLFSRYTAAAPNYPLAVVKSDMSAVKRHVCITHLCCSCKRHECRRGCSGHCEIFLSAQRNLLIHLMWPWRWEQTVKHRKGDLRAWIWAARVLIQFDSYSSSAGGGEQCACTACADDDWGASGHEILLSLYIY